MPARTDHDRRDAQHSARVAVAEAFGRYIRRVTEEAYAHIEETAASYDGTDDIDWSQVGRTSAHRALTAYGVTVAPERAISGSAVEVGVSAGELETGS